jgi:hypothetical protein
VTQYDASNRKSIRRAEKAAELAIANRIAYIRHIMSNSPGREWMYDLLARCSMFSTPFSPTNPYITSFNCGQQNVGLSIFADVTTYCPSEYNLMMQEQATKDQANGRRYDNDADSSDPAASTAGTEPDTGRDDNRPIDSDGYNHDPGGVTFVDEHGLVNWNGSGRA